MLAFKDKQRRADKARSRLKKFALAVRAAKNRGLEVPESVERNAAMIEQTFDRRVR